MNKNRKRGRTERMFAQRQSEINFSDPRNELNYISQNSLHGMGLPEQRIEGGEHVLRSVK